MTVTARSTTTVRRRPSVRHDTRALLEYRFVSLFSRDGVYVFLDAHVSGYTCVGAGASGYAWVRMMHVHNDAVSRQGICVRQIVRASKCIYHTS